MSQLSFILGYQTEILAVVGIILVLLLGYLAGRTLGVRKFARRAEHHEDRMFTIEQALKAFWDHERQNLEKQQQVLRERIDLLEKQNEEYRKKLAGLGGLMNFGRGKRADMLMGLMLENEALEEKLFEQNLKLKEERDEYLRKELKNISYKKVLLSEIMADEEVREKMDRFIRDNRRLKRVDLHPTDRPLLDDGDEDDAPRREQGSA